MGGGKERVGSVLQSIDWRRSLSRGINLFAFFLYRLFTLIIFRLELLPLFTITVEELGRPFIKIFDRLALSLERVLQALLFQLALSLAFLEYTPASKFPTLTVRHQPYHNQHKCKEPQYEPRKDEP